MNNTIRDGYLFRLENMLNLFCQFSVKPDIHLYDINNLVLAVVVYKFADLGGLFYVCIQTLCSVVDH